MERRCWAATFTEIDTLFWLFQHLNHLCLAGGLLVKETPVRATMLQPEKKIQRTAANAQTLDLQRRQPLGQGRLDVEASVRGIGAQTQQGAQHMKNGAGSPGLRNIGPAWVEHGKIEIAAPRYSGEDFWRTEALKVLDSIKNTANDVVRLFVQSIAHKALGNNAVVLRPDRATLIGQGIVSRIA